MSVLLVILLVSLSVYSATPSQLQNCDDVNKIFPGVFRLQDGSSLGKCAFNGQQCCNQVIISLVDQGLRSLVESDQLNFTSHLAGVQTAIDNMRNKTSEIITDLLNDVVRPLLLSAVPSPPSSFITVVDSVIMDIEMALNSQQVDLKVTISNYFSAAALHYFDEALKSQPLLRSVRLSDSQKKCGSQVFFNHIYSNTDSAAKLIDLLQNISMAVGMIRQLPPLFDELLQKAVAFRFSDTCLDIFTSNYLCPICHNQPFMCPGRCTEIVTGCISPLHQAIVQLDISIKLILSIVRSLIGASDSVTDAVTISRISVFYNDLVEKLKTRDFLDLGFILQVVRVCNINIFSFGKRSLSEMEYPVVNKRAIEIPNVGLNETLLKTLEQQFSSLGGDKIADATESFCSPDFTVEFLGIKIQITKPNGMCSHGVCNVGYYNSTFEKKDIADQCFNPAGQFDYDQLINQAKNQTYVLTELFSTANIPESVFSVFLPNETFPTTEFLNSSAPSKPTIVPITTCIPTTSTPITTATVTTSTTIPTPTGPCPANIEGKVKYKKNKKRVKFTFLADNPDATFKCQLDDQDPEPCTSPMIWIKEFDEGRHPATLYTSCIGTGGNTVTSVQSFYFRVR